MYKYIYNLSSDCHKNRGERSRLWRDVLPLWGICERAKGAKRKESLALSISFSSLCAMRSWLMAFVMFRGQESSLCPIQEDLWIGWTQGNPQLRSGRTHDVILCGQGEHSYCFFRLYSWIVLRCVGIFFVLLDTFERLILLWAMERFPFPWGRLFRTGGVSVSCWGCECGSTTRKTPDFADAFLVMQTEFKGMENCN